MSRPFLNDKLYKHVRSGGVLHRKVERKRPWALKGSHFVGQTSEWTRWKRLSAFALCVLTVCCCLWGFLTHNILTHHLQQPLSSCIFTSPNSAENKVSGSSSVFTVFVSLPHTNWKTSDSFVVHLYLFVWWRDTAQGSLELCAPPGLWFIFLWLPNGMLS